MNEDELEGRELESRQYGSFIVVGKERPPEIGESFYRIRFTETGYSYLVRKREMLKGSVKDPYQPSVAGVGFMGEPKQGDLTDRLYSKLKDAWKSMIYRCYKADDAAYPNYGARGVQVC